MSTILFVTSPTPELAACNKNGDIPIEKISFTIFKSNFIFENLIVITLSSSNLNPNISILNGNFPAIRNQSTNIADNTFPINVA